MISGWTSETDHSHAERTCSAGRLWQAARVPAARHTVACQTQPSSAAQCGRGVRGSLFALDLTLSCTAVLLDQDGLVFPCKTLGFSKGLRGLLQYPQSLASCLVNYNRFRLKLCKVIQTHGLTVFSPEPCMQMREALFLLSLP